MVIEAAATMLILAILSAGCYWASLKWVAIRHQRDMLVDEYERAKEHIDELESRVAMLEADRDNAMAQAQRQQPDGYNVFNMRG